MDFVTAYLLVTVVCVVLAFAVAIVLSDSAVANRRKKRTEGDDGADKSPSPTKPSNFLFYGYGMIPPDYDRLYWLLFDICCDWRSGRATDGGNEVVRAHFEHAVDAIGWEATGPSRVSITEHARANMPSLDGEPKRVEC